MAENSSQVPSKARISVVDKDGKEISPNKMEPLVCLYNPSSITINRGAQWDTKPIRTEGHSEPNYTGGGAATVSVTLLFDTTRDMSSLGITAGTDVRKYTDFLFNLMEPKKDPKATHRPPYCRFEWGGGLYLVIGFVQSVKVDYKLFLADGTPIRAEASVTFEEIKTEHDLDTAPQNPTSHSAARKTWIVREGDRLDWIAHQEYGKAAHWRHIAETNNIDNPFSLQPGQILKLVPLP